MPVGQVNRDFLVVKREVSLAQMTRRFSDNMLVSGRFGLGGGTIPWRCRLVCGARTRSESIQLPSGMKVRALLYLVFIPLLAVLAGACAGGPPQANVTASATQGPAPLTVKFTNASQDGDEFRWDFGDGSTPIIRTSRDPVAHEYTVAGTHQASLTAIKKGDPPQTSTATVTVTVEPGPLDRVIIESTESEVEVSQTMEFIASAVDQFGNPIPGLKYVYREDERAGRVDGEGGFTATTVADVFPNAVTVEVRQGSVTRSATAQVTVLPGALDHVTILPAVVVVKAVGVQRFQARARDRYGNHLPGLRYAFRSDPRAGQVDAGGQYTAGINAGTYPGGVSVEVVQGPVTKEATADVTVEPRRLDHVVIEPAELTLEAGTEGQFSPTAFDRYGNSIQGLRYAFAANERAGVVDSQGRFTAGIVAGVYDEAVAVEVSQDGVTVRTAARVVVTHGPLLRVSVSPPSVTLDIGQTQQLTVEPVDAHGNPIAEAQIAWDAAPGVGDVAPKGLLSAGTRAGTYDRGVRATAVLGQVAVEAVASVTVRPGGLHSLSVAPVDIVAGETRHLESIATDQYGNRVRDVQVVWTVRDGNAGTVTTGGLLTAGGLAGTFPDAIEVRAVQGKVTLTAHATVAVRASGPVGEPVVTPPPVPSEAPPSAEVPPYAFSHSWGSETTGAGQMNNPSGIAVGPSGKVFVADTDNHRVQVFGSDGSFVRQWGELGVGRAQFNAPEGIAVDSAGHVYVADSGNHRIQKFRSDGAFITSWGGRGAGEGQFNRPRDVSVDHAGGVYVVDGGNNRIQKFTSLGMYLRQWGGSGQGEGRFRSPRGVAVDALADVYVTDAVNDRVQKFTSDGGFIAEWGCLAEAEHCSLGVSVDGNGNVYVGTKRFLADGTPDSKWELTAGGAVASAGLADVAVDASGNVYVAVSWNHRVQRYSPEGTLLAQWGSDVTAAGRINMPSRLAVGGNGVVYVVDTRNDRIQSFAPDGTIITQWGSPGTGDGQLMLPTDVGVGPDGAVYVTDCTRVQRFSVDGAFISAWETEPPSEGRVNAYVGLVMGKDGSVYVSDTVNHRIQRFAPDGTVAGGWGALGTGEGQFDSPEGLAVDGEGNVYVADSGNDRMQVFTSDGIPIAVWGGRGTGDGQFRAPADVAVDDKGNVYVADRFNDRVQVFTSGGTFIAQLGRSGTGHGQFNWPEGVAVDDAGNVYVVDSRNHRVQVFPPRSVGR